MTNIDEEGTITQDTLESVYGIYGLTPVDLLISPVDNTHTACVGTARVLQGNARTIGKKGAFGAYGVRVQAGSAVVAPEQFGTNTAGLAPYAPQIQGTVSPRIPLAPVPFVGVTDVIGPGSDRAKLLRLNPDNFLIELPSASMDYGVAPIELQVPSALGCPTGTLTRR